MNEQDIDRLVRTADPYDATGVDLHGADQALLEEIMGIRKDRSIRTRLIGAVAVAAALTAAVGIPAVIDERDQRKPATTQPDRPTTSRTPYQQPEVVTDRIRFTSAAIEVAEQNPRILVTAPGWKVRHLGGFSATSGEMGFQLGPDKWRDFTDEGADGELLTSGRTNDAPSLSVDWYPADQYESYRQDRATERRVQQVEVLGTTAQMVSYSGTDHAVMLPPEDGVFIELRGGVGDEAAFKRFLAESIRKVGVREWLAALPAEMVTAQNAGERLEQVVADIPLPPGFEKSLLARDVALDRYQFGALVTGQVACGWIRLWERGDATQKAAAAKALATSRDWKILDEMNAEGDYPEAVWQYADEIAAGKLPEGYQQGLGCD